MRSLIIQDKDVLYSWRSLIGFSIIIGIFIWSYTNHIGFVLYSTSALFVLCVSMIQTYASRKGKGYNALSFFMILWPCVLLTIALAVAYIIVDFFRV